MKTGTIVGILAVVVLLGAGAWYFMSPSAAAPQSDSNMPVMPAGDMAPTGTTSSNTAPAGQSSIGVSVGADASLGTAAAMSATITLTASGFSPSNITIKKGGTVTWSAEASGQMLVASNNHPTHTLYDGTSMQQHCAAGYTGPAPLDECSAGQSFVFTFNKVGAWGYHNHFNPSETGTVTVVQ